MITDTRMEPQQIKELVIISGKGGTGKTSLMAAFASLGENHVLCDADVDAADLHLILNPEVISRSDFKSGKTAVINKDLCTECGLCREMCRWDAIGTAYEVNAIDCEGCGVCVHFCPEAAIEFPENTCGEWFLSDTRCGPMVHARLGIAEENSGKLVTLVRQEVRKLAAERQHDLILTDGPPGVGCPVIASIGGATAVLIVTEPTVAGQHDMERVAQLAAHFKIPAMVCVNKFDLNLGLTREIEKYAEERDIACLGRIPFDPIFTKAMIQAQTIFEYNSGSQAGQAVADIWQRLSTAIGLKKHRLIFSKEVFTMKFAIPLAEGKLTAHFGHCQEFALVEVEDNKITNKQTLVPPPHEPGVLPRWLHEQGANIIIAGGMGARALDLFTQNGIKVLTGAPSLAPEELVQQYLDNSLLTGANVCDH